jgi:hypothetical protein
MSVLTPSLAYGAESNLEFGNRFIPTKLVEGKEGIIQIFATTGSSPIPEKIPGLTVTSLDSKILRVLTVEDSESGFVTELTVKGIKSGTTKLFLAAPGFSSQELPVTVYGNVLNQEKLLVKTIPSTFSSDGTFKGLIYVELVDEDGFPVKANEPIDVFLSPSNSNLLNIFQPNIVIEKDEYFAGSPFEVIPTGESEKANIYVTAEDMEAKSADITIDEMEDMTVKLYFFRDNVNVANTATGHIVVQLQKDGDSDNDGEPVLATQDILVKYKLTNEFTLNQVGEKTSTIKIKKGEYWGSDTVTFPANQVGEHLITISAAEPLTLETKTVNTVTQAVNEGDRFVKFESLPILATGHKELIGILYLQDANGAPLIAENNQEIEINTSDMDFLSVDNVFLPKGSGAVLVYADVSSSIPDGDDAETVEINPVAEIAGGTAATFVEAEVFGPSEGSLTLIAEPTIPKILAGTEFPIVLYLKEGNRVVEFPSNSQVFASPSDIFDVETKSILDGNYLVTFNTKALDSGTDTIQFTINDFADASVNLESLSMKPANIIIDHSETIFTGSNDIFSIQLVNSAGLPVFAPEDIDITFVVDDPSKIQIPQTLTIKKGEYFTIFDAGPKSGGVTEISALSDGIPISKTSIKITSRTPTLLLEVPELIENSEVFTVKVAANQDDLPLDGLKVNWTIDGGILQISDKKTGPTGEAIASIISTSGKAVKVQASVSGSYYDTNSISKTVKVNSTASEFLAFAEEEPGFVKPEIAGIDPVIIIVPAIIVLMGYMLIKKGVLKIKNPKVVEQVPQAPQEVPL